MWELILIVAGYLFVLFGFRALGGVAAASDAIADWGRRSSERRRASIERRFARRR